MMNDWISVEDRLPDEMYERVKSYNRRKHFIVYTKSGLVCVARFRFKSADGMFKNYFTRVDYYSHLNVTHWMPLPKPPKEQNNG